MNLLIYILVYPIIWLLSILPFRILYFISDGVYLLVYYVIGYRKKVVFNNLKLSFPEKSDKELVKISKKFYHHFVDVFIEMIKSFTISEKEILEHYKFTNVEILNDLEAKKKKSINRAVVHTLKPGESLYDVSQKYGIQLSALYKINKLRYGVQPDSGTPIYLNAKVRKRLKRANRS